MGIRQSNDESQDQSGPHLRIRQFFGFKSLSFGSDGDKPIDKPGYALPSRTLQFLPAVTNLNEAKNCPEFESE
jgi:hypothetical protein